MVNLTTDEALWVYNFILGGPVNEQGQKVMDSIREQIDYALNIVDEHFSGK